MIWLHALTGTGASYRHFTMKRKSSKNKLCCDPEPLLPEPGADDEALAEMAKAIGHPARVQIVQLLLRREHCICGEIVDELPLAQSTVSQHLKVLKNAGLIRGDIDGPRICYCVNRSALARLKELVIAL
jgi:ArsR family transcriptional regulator